MVSTIGIAEGVLLYRNSYIRKVTALGVLC